MKELNTKDESVLKILNSIEEEMKGIGYWNKKPPEFKVNSYIDAPSFELWLQCIFIPNATNAANTGKYPSNSNVGEMAMRQYNYHSYIEEAQPLLALLREFDFLINSFEKTP